MQPQPYRFPLFRKVVDLWEVVDLFLKILILWEVVDLFLKILILWEVVDLFYTQINTINPSRRS